jgi:hypothetical protein
MPSEPYDLDGIFRESGLGDTLVLSVTPKSDGILLRPRGPGG